MNKTKVGIIGCGGIANGKHLPALKKLAASSPQAADSSLSSSGRGVRARRTPSPIRRKTR